MKIKDVVKASQNADTGGRKFDGGKLQYGLVPPLALKEMVKVLTFGAEKYEPDNWKYVPDSKRRYFDAMHGYLHESRSAAAPAPTVLQYWSLRADNHPVPKAPDFLLCSTVQS